MTNWYLSYDNERIGPLDESQALLQAEKNPNGLAWREGFAKWMPISQVPELMVVESPPPLPSSTENIVQPEPFLQTTKVHFPAPSGGVSDVIDYKIYGSEMQFVEVELDPGESVVSEAGAMMYKDIDVAMETVFGDTSAQSTGGGFLDKLVGAGKRLLTGESLFMTVFTHTGNGKAHVAFGAPYPGNIIPVSLKEIGGKLICQKDSFLCAAKGVTIGIYLQKRILTGLFGGEGFIMQKLEGDGMVFMHAGGTVVERVLRDGEVLHVDTGCVVALEATIGFDIQQAGGIKTSLFGGEGLFFATLQGPGKCWLQSLPFSRLAGRMLQAAPQKGGNKGEGSILGGLGNFFNGDND